MAKITITITKTEDDKFTAKCGTSVGGGQDKIKDKTFDEVKDFIGDVIRNLDSEGYIGRK